MTRIRDLGSVERRLGICPAFAHAARPMLLPTHGAPEPRGLHIGIPESIPMHSCPLQKAGCPSLDDNAELWSQLPGLSKCYYHFGDVQFGDD